MAKIRDELIRRAANCEAGAKDTTLTAVKQFTVRIGEMRELRNGEGKVYKMVSTLQCEAVVVGVPEPVVHTSEMEAGPSFGVFGELEQCFSPALKEFLNAIQDAVKKNAKKAAAPLDPAAAPPLLSDPNRPKDLSRSERMKAINARRRAEGEARRAAEAAGTQTEEQVDEKEVDAAEGGES